MKAIHIGIAAPGLAGTTTLLSSMVSLYGGDTREDNSRWHWLRTTDLAAPVRLGGRAYQLAFTRLGGNHYHPHIAFWREYVPTCDVILFLFDSQNARMDANEECLESVAFNVDLRARRGLILFSKRDTPDAAPVDDLLSKLNHMGWPHIAGHPASHDTARGVVQLIVQHAARQRARPVE